MQEPSNEEEDSGEEGQVRSKFKILTLTPLMEQTEEVKATSTANIPTAQAVIQSLNQDTINTLMSSQNAVMLALFVTKEKVSYPL